MSASIDLREFIHFFGVSGDVDGFISGTSADIEVKD